jgi:hypothetical protein
MALKEWKIDSTSDTKTLKTIVDEIDNALKGDSGINLDPDYQREYKFTQQEESLLIESILMNIPIPIIYLSSDINIIPYVANVIDGQHRLRAVYRFIKNEFQLKGLENYDELNGNFFDDLEKIVQNKLLYQSSLKFENIHVQNNPELEIEIFKRYNRGTHPLSPQEIRHTVYTCKFNVWFNAQVKSFFLDSKLSEIYNISKKRYADKTAHEAICIMMEIICNGLNKKYISSPKYADIFFERISKITDQDSAIEEIGKGLDEMNRFLMMLHEDYNIIYPFSKEIYGIGSRNYKLQLPILMIMSAFIKYLKDNKIDIVDKQNLKSIKNAIAITLENSYLETGFKGSNTRPDILQETLEYMIKNYNEFTKD